MKEADLEVLKTALVRGAVLPGVFKGDRLEAFALGVQTALNIIVPLTKLNLPKRKKDGKAS